MLCRDPRDEGLGPVAAGNAEQIGSAVDRLPGQFGHVDGARASSRTTSAPSSSAWRWRSKFATLPPPECGFMISTG